MSNRLPPSTRAPQILLDLDAAEKSVLAETFSRHANSSDSLIRQVRRGISDALCVFLLFWAINLEHLDIALPTNGGSLEIMQCLERVPPTPPDYTFTPQDFQRLERVSLKGDTSHYADGQQMAPVLRLPVLTTLRLAWMSLEHLAQAESGIGIGNEFPRSTSSLETLVIKNCRVTYAGLTVLTTACQSLRHLDLTWHRGLSKLLQPGTELIGALPSSIETVKFSDNSSGFKTNQWLAFFEDIMDHRSFLADLKIINMWDIPIQKRYYDLCTTHITARYSPEETSKLLLHGQSKAGNIQLTCKQLMIQIPSAIQYIGFMLQETAVVTGLQNSAGGTRTGSAVDKYEMRANESKCGIDISP